ncbi:MAG: fungal-specific transcription factor domain-containing protein [Benniella sp.]|nr:MAG: fungal-specific transcription factor domain-containing protein [Benniella sp.]
MAEVTEEFHQNQEGAKRFKGGQGQKRKQPGSDAIPSASPSSFSPVFYPESNGNVQSYSYAIFHPHHQPPWPTSQVQGSPTIEVPRGGPGGVLPEGMNTSATTEIKAEAPESLSGSQFMANEMNALTAMLSETTLSNNMAYYGPSAAPMPDDLDDDDLWAPHIRSTQIENLVVPPEMRILPDLTLRQYLSDLYYENHFVLLPMVQRQVLRVCEANIHMPHCLLLCNAIYFCGSMFSGDTMPLRKVSGDEGSVGEDFFLRGQALLDQKYLTTHVCTIQALLLFAIGHKSPAQRSGFISQAITMALDMGLHIKLDDTVNRFEKAYRARVFWCCFFFDSTSSAIGGKPTLINDEDITVDMTVPGDLGPETDHCSDQYFVHCVRGWTICRKIRKNSKLFFRRPPPSQQVLLENLDRLDKELVEWQEHLPPVFDLVPAKGSMMSNISSMAAVAQLLCYALIILLHHPYLPNPKNPEAFQPPPPEGGPPDSQGYCTQAAKEITRISGLLLKEAPRTFEQNTPSRYALNFAIRIHLRNAKCTFDANLARESRRDLQRSMDYVEQVENLQFFRINRAKKSDVADLLASCRAALAQQKSTLDLAKEAAAAKRQQMMQERQSQKQQQLLLQQQQQQQQHQLQLQLQLQLQQQQLQLQGQMAQPGQHQVHAQQSTSTVLSSHIPVQQDPQHQYQLHQQRLQQLAHEKQMAQKFLAQQQQQLHTLRQQHQQHQLLRQQMQGREQQQLQQQHLHLQQQLQHQQLQQQQQGLSNSSLQNASLFQGQPAFVYSSTLPGVPLEQPILVQPSPLVADHPPNEQLSQQHPLNAPQASWISTIDPNAPSLISQTQGVLPGSDSYLDPLQGGNPPEDAVDIHSITIDPSQEALFSTAASNIYNDTMTYRSAIPASSISSPSPLMPATALESYVVEEVLSRSAVPYPSPATTSITSVSGHNHFSPTSSSLEDEALSPQSFTSSSTTVSPLMHSVQLQRQQQSLFSAVSDSMNNSNFSPYMTTATTHQQLQQQLPSTPEMPLSSSVVNSPSMPTEEAVLQSFTGQLMHDTFYMHVNLPAEHPRNDPTSFVYLPSELEYGDAAAATPTPSPGASGSSHSSP